MSWIKEIEFEESDGKLREIYSDIIESRGKLSNIMKVHSLLPDSMKAHMDLYLSIMFNNNKLKRELKELIGVIVSVCNNCEYCINHHAEALNFYWRDSEKIERLITNFRNLELPLKTTAVISYAEKLTLHPHRIAPADVENLHVNGFSDEDILNINLIVSYFNFVNRIVLGLGVEFSKEEMQGYKY